jgi:autotransporter-associated beta strand protein
VILDGTLDLSVTLSGSSIKSLSGTTGLVWMGSGITLTITAANDTFAGSIGATAGDAGSLVLSGGTEKLTGTSHYSGTTTINGGTLEVDGTIATSSGVTVNAGGTLAGIGSVGNTQVNAGGTFAPGSGVPGTMSVAGNLAFQSGAIYLVQVNPSTASSATVTGTATLAGATVNAAFASGSYVAKQYTILTAGSVNGTFGTLVNSNLPAGFQTSLSYDGTHAYLDLALGFGPSSSPNFGGGLSANQQAVGNALVNSFNTNGGIPLVFGTATPAGLTQLSGESATGSQQTTFDAMGQFMGVLTDPTIAGRGDPISAGGNPNAYADEGGLTGLALRVRRASATPMPRCMPRRWLLRASSSAGASGRRGSVDRRRPMAMRPPLGPRTPPAASTARQSAPIIEFRLIRWPALHSPAAARASV